MEVAAGFLAATSANSRQCRRTVFLSLSMATEPARTAQGMMLFIPENGTNIIQAGHRIPGTMIQPPVMPQYVGQQNETPSSFCEALEKFIKVETRTLGAIQILIGLIHIGLGIISIIFFMNSGILQGIFFIASGSLSVSADKSFNNSLMKCSLCMNITSAVMAASTTILYLVVLSLFYADKSDPLNSVGFCISLLLLLFSILEFVITVLVVHFGCRTVCCNSDPEMVALPCIVDEDGMTLREANPTAPAY